MEPTRATKFEAVAKAIEGRVSIVGTQIDPDALASAFGLAHALEAVRGGALRSFVGGQALPLRTRRRWRVRSARARAVDERRNKGEVEAIVSKRIQEWIFGDS